MAERERERRYEINMVRPYKPSSLMGIYSRLPRDEQYLKYKQSQDYFAYMPSKTMLTFFALKVELDIVNLD